MVCCAIDGCGLQFTSWSLGGATWLSKLQQLSEEMIQSLSASNPLWNALYEQICKDQGIVPRGDSQHKLMILENMFSGEAWKVKGDKVSLRRWFSLLKAADLYLPRGTNAFLYLWGMARPWEYTKH